MIKKIENMFKIDTKDTTYLIRISPFGHLLNDYYGAYIPDCTDFEFSKEKISYPPGTNTIYEESDLSYSLDMLSLEIGTIGKGDYKEPSIHLKTKEGYVLDLRYRDFKINEKSLTKASGLPSFHDVDVELMVFLEDKEIGVEVVLRYAVFFESNVIARNISVVNGSKNSLEIIRAMSMQFEFTNDSHSLLSLYGCWGGEAKKSINKLNHTTYVIDSKTGNSSNRHNPFFMLTSKDSSYSHGDVYGFNLIYSGNHCETIEHNTFDKVRVQIGISPFCFTWKLEPDTVFDTPYAIMTFSDRGRNGVSQNFHDFINTHLISKEFSFRERPSVINNWEVTMMKFKEPEIIRIAKKAKQFGIEVSVLDDGWFSNRNNDNSGLGDYDVNRKKLPSGIKGLAKRVNKIGLQFGLWFEPEMVNEDSKLFKEHPDYIVKSSVHSSSLGRHQHVLDLTRTEVRDYIVKSVNDILDNNNIAYVKWDMNRNISEFSSDARYSIGEFFHRYQLGLYDLFERIVRTHPHILFEGCASGGNRFDLGILHYMPQIWASDDTDPVERITIQSGLALGYPLSSISNHISSSPSKQVLRPSSLETRFNVASFGVLGFELDLSHLSRVEKAATERHLAFYNNHRALFQYGDFYQLADIIEDNKAIWMVVSKDKKEAVLGYFNGLQKVNQQIDVIKTSGLDDNKTYEIGVLTEELNLKMFGSLINLISPIRLNEHGFIIDFLSKRKTLSGEKESYHISGKALNSGALKLVQQWLGTGIGDSVRVLGNFGSRLYYIREKLDS